MSGGANDSPARNALQGHLNANLSLKKKISWFNSLREVVQKGALTAKATIDDIRGESASNAKQEMWIARAPFSFWRLADHDSADKERSFIKRPINDSYTPRSATISLRRHMPRHTASTSLFRSASRASLGNRLSGVNEIELSVKDEQDSPSASFHKKRNSMADSLVGSLRDLGRKASKHMSPIPSARLPAQCPLPSSPVSIPIPAPAPLTIDFGRMSFMSSTFNKGVITKTGERKRSADSDNVINSASDDPFAPHFRGHSDAHLGPLTPGMLEIPRGSLDFGLFDFSPSPMPGTNHTIEVDGARDEQLRLFERSVMAQECRPQLRPMRSLAAMTNELPGGSLADDQALPQARSLQPQSLHGLDMRSASGWTASTTPTCPSDMEELTRQPGSGLGAYKTDGSTSFGPPSPTRTVRLPFRPKQKNNATDASISIGAGLLVGHTSSQHYPSSSCSPPASETFGSRRISGTEAPARSTTAPPKRHDSATAQDIACPWPIETPAPLVSQALSRRCHHGRDGSILTDYDEFKTQQLFGDNNSMELPEYDHVGYDPVDYDYVVHNHADSPVLSPDGSPHGGPLVAQLYQSIPSPQQSSPIARTTDVGEIFWKVAPDQWLPDSSNVSKEVGAISTHMRGGTGSIDDSVNEQERHQGSPQAHSASLESMSDQTIRMPNMGDRMEFELKRSARNMRYNALHPFESSGHSHGPHPESQQLAYVGPNSSSCSNDATVQLSHPTNASQETLLPQYIKPQGHDPQESEDSSVVSLPDAVWDVGQLLFEQPDPETPLQLQTVLGSPESGYDADDDSGVVETSNSKHSSGRIVHNA